MFRNIIYSIVFTLIIFLAVGMFLPRWVHVERSIEIQRPPVTVFTVVNSYRSFMAWSPWTERDPEAVYEFSGPLAGVGARLNWRGDPRQVGSGWQQITHSEPASLVRMQMHFDQQGFASTYFQIDPLPSGARVTWGFDADLVQGQGMLQGILARYFGLFFDAWVGTDYERGLARLKDLVEDLPPADFSGFEVEVLLVEPMDILLERMAVPREAGTQTPDLSPAYREIVAFMSDHNVERIGQPMAISRIRDGRTYAIEAAIPAKLGDIVPGGRIQAGQSPGGRALRALHRGPYDSTGPSYEKLAAWMAAHGFAGGDVSWERYMSNPRETPPEERITEIYVLLTDEP